MRNLLFGIIGLCLITVLVAAYLSMDFLLSPSKEKGGGVVFEVEPGATFKTVARRLEDAGLVRSAWKFYWYGRLRQSDSRIRVGEYALRSDMRPAEILHVIVSGKSIERPITIQEGLNVFEIAGLFEREGLASREDFLRLVQDPSLVRELLGESVNSLEGYLYPETYRVTKYTGARGLIKAMVDRFIMVYREIPPHGMSRHELVTLASIVEKETGAPEERPIISSVFHNRMRKGMRLQTDPTVIYGLFAATGHWNKNITKADLTSDTPYNTYTRSGLPPGPIANPGREALLAAARPATTEFYYFVSRNDGTHVFSKDYKGHEAAVRSYQLDRRARQGKSWRDLKKRGGSSPASGDATN